MIEFKEISADNLCFAKNVFETSFPIEERPLFDTILHARNKTIFHFNVVYLNGNPVGIFSYWTFDKFTYVEHFAVGEQYRNNGVGQRIMKHFLSGITQVVLEVEMPATAMAQRRIDFYKRLGFDTNPHNYIQPSYHNDGNTLPMIIMSLSPLSASTFAKVKQCLYSEVYHAECIAENN